MNIGAHDDPPDMTSILQTRRSPSLDAFTGEGPDAVTLETMLTLASRVPDHGKLAPWRFILFQGEGRARAGAILSGVFAAANPEAEARRVEAERKRLLMAPLVVAVASRPVSHPKVPEWEQVLSAGAVCMSLVVAATALGFGATWLTEWYAYDRTALDRLGFAPDERAAGFIHIGRVARAREDRPRPALDAIVTRF